MTLTITPTFNPNPSPNLAVTWSPRVKCQLWSGNRLCDASRRGWKGWTPNWPFYGRQWQSPSPKPMQSIIHAWGLMTHIPYTVDDFICVMLPMVTRRQPMVFIPGPVCFDSREIDCYTTIYIYPVPTHKVGLVILASRNSWTNYAQRCIAKIGDRNYTREGVGQDHVCSTGTLETVLTSLKSCSCVWCQLDSGSEKSMGGDRYAFRW